MNRVDFINACLKATPEQLAFISRAIDVYAHGSEAGKQMLDTIKTVHYTQKELWKLLKKAERA